MKKKGFTLIELLVVIAIIAMLLAILMPALGKVKKLAMRLVCGTNLKGMANALNVYAFDYRDEYPIAGGKGTHTWTGTTTNWQLPGKDWNVAGNISVAASLFMLVREADVGVKSFICTSSDEQPFVNTQGCDVVELWDFGGTPKDWQSYSYQLPYDTTTRNYPADGTSNPGNAIMADKNPFYDPDLEFGSGAGSADTYMGLADQIDLSVGAQKFALQIGNAASHDREGQNVLFNDGHVSFEKRPDVGTRYDNIYLPFAGSAPYDEVARRRGGPWYGINNTGAKSLEDSNLVNDDVIGP